MDNIAKLVGYAFIGWSVAAAIGAAVGFKEPLACTQGWVDRTSPLWGCTAAGPSTPDPDEEMEALDRELEKLGIVPDAEEDFGFVPDPDDFSDLGAIPRDDLTGGR